MTRNIDNLKDIESPEDAINLLLGLADLCAEASLECENNWQSKSAGEPWSILSSELMKASDQAKRRILKSGYPLET